LCKEFWGVVIDLTVTKKKKDLVKSQSGLDKNKTVIKMRARCTIAFSLLCLVINFLLYLYLSDCWATKSGLIAALDAFYALANSMIGIVLGLGISTLALDFFSYIQYAQDRIKEVMIEKDYLDTLSSDEKREIIGKLESSLYFKNAPIPEDSLYVNIKSKILPFLEKNYLDDYFLHIDCSIEGNVIRKNMTHELIIYSYADDAEYTLPFSVYMDKSSSSSYRVETLSFNKKRIAPFDSVEHVDQTVTRDERNTEVYKNHLKFPFKLKRGKNIITYTSVSTVDISDISYTHNLTMPCKHYVAEFALHDSEYNVRGYGFSIDKQDGLDIKYFNNTCRIEFNDWTIPGDGIIFTLSKRLVQSADKPLQVQENVDLENGLETETAS